MSVFFTSDLHIGHAKVAHLRWPAMGYAAPSPQPSVETAVIAWHDEILADRWDATVVPGDIVWVLGDISAGGKGAQLNALQWLSNRPGEKHLISGNHDGCHPMHRDSHKWQPEYLKVFSSVQPFARRRVGGTSVLLSHFPYAGDHTEQDRYAQYRLPDHSELLLHGHVHSTFKRWGEREIHVGVDAWGFKPVHLDEVAELIGGVAC